VGTIRSVQELSGSRVLTIEFPGQFSRYVVPVGSIALNGVSLTVASVTENRCTLSIIPYTLEQTTLGEAKSGVKVNVEFDLIGKYVERMFPGSTGRGGISGQQLEEWGYGE
jgi:riboflavin synthase